MSNPLLQRATPVELADRGQIIENQEEIKQFPRLSEIVRADFCAFDAALPGDKWRQAPVAIRLRFGWADPAHTMPVLEGHVAATVPAVCQRCLEPFDFALEADLKLLFREPGGRADEAADYDVWELDTAAIRPLDVLDEALVMAMPFSAMHESSDDCGPLADKVIVEDKAGDKAGDWKEVRPFANLRSQMRHKD